MASPAVFSGGVVDLSPLPYQPVRKQSSNRDVGEALMGSRSRKAESSRWRTDEVRVGLSSGQRWCPVL